MVGMVPIEVGGLLEGMVRVWIGNGSGSRRTIGNKLP